jgi:glycosyltransferase involved in cell wall biosynthesis
MTIQTNLLKPLEDRGPLRVLFLLTSMPVGGAETLLVNLVRKLDRSRFLPEIACLKERGPLGEELAGEIPVHSELLRSKYDPRVVSRLKNLIQQRRIDAVITVGAGDKMFWGRIAARLAGIPVILSALHSTGWPDGVGRLNRLLTRWTDGFIAVAAAHGRHLREHERFPAEKVFVIPNGIDTTRFRFDRCARERVREDLQLDAEAPVCGIVAALRPEKNHELFLAAASRVIQQLPEARFVIVGDGPQRSRLERMAQLLNLSHAVRFAGTRSDIPDLLAAFDLFALTSHNEANPVSILEAMSIALPVVATRVGSVAEMVLHGETGEIVSADDARGMTDAWLRILSDRKLAAALGSSGRKQVEQFGSLRSMVSGYEELIESIYRRKVSVKRSLQPGRAATTDETAAV